MSRPEIDTSDRPVPHRFDQAVEVGLDMANFALRVTGELSSSNGRSW
jgi:hypothetical protein